MEELERFKSEAKKRDLCGQYTRKWDGCHSKKQLFDLAMDSNGIPYLCKSMVEGWGVQADFLKRKFKPFINGRYKSEQNGYTSMMYVDVDDNIHAESTNVVIIASRCTIIVRANQMINLFCVNSTVDIMGQGTVYLRKYGKCDVKLSLQTKVIEEEM